MFRDGRSLASHQIHQDRLERRRCDLKVGYRARIPDGGETSQMENKLPWKHKLAKEGMWREDRRQEAELFDQ